MPDNGLGWLSLRQERAQEDTAHCSVPCTLRLPGLRPAEGGWGLLGLLLQVFLHEAQRGGLSTLCGDPQAPAVQPSLSLAEWPKMPLCPLRPQAPSPTGVAHQPNLVHHFVSWLRRGERPSSAVLPFGMCSTLFLAAASRLSGEDGAVQFRPIPGLSSRLPCAPALVSQGSGVCPCGL